MQDPFGNYVVQYVLKTCSRYAEDPSYPSSRVGSFTPFVCFRFALFSSVCVMSFIRSKCFRLFLWVLVRKGMVISCGGNLMCYLTFTWHIIFFTLFLLPLPLPLPQRGDVHAMFRTAWARGVPVNAEVLQ